MAVDMRCAAPRWLFIVVIATGCTAAHGRPDDADAAVIDVIVDAARELDAARSDAGVARTCDVSGGIGSACSTDADCREHASFSPAICLPPGRGAAMGYCSSVCMIDADCGACGRCVASSTGTSPAPTWYGLCVRACDADEACRDGYVCASFAPLRDGCFPDCRSHAGLCGGARCSATTGACDVGCAVDSDCSDGSRCADGRCVCGASTACMPGSTCGPNGTCGCTDASACGPGHGCNAMIQCCEWGSRSCG